MRWIVFSLSVVLLFAGCGGWGDYVHKSDNFDFSMAFPVGWEVDDRSDGEHDYLTAAMPGSPGSKIIVIAQKRAPDIDANEVYPSFLEAGDIVTEEEFRIIQRRTISCKTTDGRSLEFQYLGPESTMRGLRAIFIGSKPGLRIVVEVRTELYKDDYILHEEDMRKMISEIQLLD
ncbi:MAG: hypothetical protein P9M15_08335 [Candidatus Electryoneaceae bacterium]|nr:hypothetical protein [Candidatus Electryoneaceae bacterium]